jgi:TRAP-type mannitol/chloroaromatic compound transport system permease large subunit
MVKAGYDKKFASGIICAGGCLGILIPPSIMLIVYSVIAQLSPLRLFAAAIFPGLMLAGLYIAYAVTRAWLNPSIAPKPPCRRYTTKSRNFKRSISFFCSIIWINNVSSWNYFSWNSYTCRSSSSWSFWCNTIILVL